MQKIGLSVLENMVKQNITNRELDFILYIARFQNEYGVVTGVYYKDVCDAINLSYQGFYDCKKSLEEKGIISCEKNNYFDWDITILNNSFKGKENYGRGYVNIHCDMVRDPEFRNCKVGAKLLALLLLRDWRINLKQSKSESFKILRENFLNKYTKLFGVSRRMVREYLGELKPFISIYLEEGKKYFLTFKKKAIQNVNDNHGRNKADTENGELRYHDIEVACRRNRIKECQDKLKSEMDSVLRQHHSEIGNMFHYDLSAIVSKSLDIMNAGRRDKYKWKRALNVSLVHKVLMQELNGTI